MTRTLNTTPTQPTRGASWCGCWLPDRAMPRHTPLTRAGRGLWQANENSRAKQGTYHGARRRRERPWGAGSNPVRSSRGGVTASPAEGSQSPVAHWTGCLIGADARLPLSTAATRVSPVA